MPFLDIEAIHGKVRGLDFKRGTPAEISIWCDDDEESRVNLAIEGTALETDEYLLFDILCDEAASPALATQIILKVLAHRAAALPTAEC